MNKKGMLGNLIGAFIVILIGIALIPVIMEKMKTAQENGAIPSDSMTSTMLGLVPIIFALAVIGSVVGIVYSSLRSVGFFGESIESETEPKKKRKGKQTYLEFVQERLAVEREMRKADGIFWWIKS